MFKKKLKLIGIKSSSAFLLSAFILICFCVFASGAYGIVLETRDIIGRSVEPVPTPLGEAYALESSPPYTVALDAGHGNFDIGAKGIIKELELCEKTVAALYTILSEDKNYMPILTRKTGEAPKISERANVANENRASLFLSIHGNSDGSSRTSGFECFPTPPGRLYSEQSMKFAQRIAAQMADAGHKLRGENGIRFAYYNGKQKKIVDSCDTKVRSMKSFGVLEKVLCPAVLTEQCFVTNREDVANWAGDEGSKKAAAAYYKAICEYFGTTPIDTK